MNDKLVISLGADNQFSVLAFDIVFQIYVMTWNMDVARNSQLRQNGYVLNVKIDMYELTSPISCFIETDTRDFGIK